MRILVLGLNYAPEPIGIAVYTAGLCEELARMGHDVRVVSGKPYYPNWRIAPGYGRGWRTTTEHGVSLTRCPLYVPSRPSGLKRLFHHASFALSALIPMLFAAYRFRPDIVFTIAPSLPGAPVAWLAGRLAGAKSWLHIQDFEVEAAFATGLLDAGSKSARLARTFEARVISLFDTVSSISPEMCARLPGLGVRTDRIQEFRNWADLDGIRPLAAVSEFREAWSIATPHVALYSGNIANKQGIEIVIEAAERLRHRTDLTFVICGEGPNRAALERAITGLPNVQIHDLQPVARLSELLGLATIHLLPQKADAADLVLPSKLTNMLASGRPVIATAHPHTGLAREVDGCGIVTAPGDADALAAAVEILLDDEPRRRTLGIAARRRADEHWSRRQIIGRVERAFAALVSRPSIK